MTPLERFLSKVDKAGPIPQERPDLGPCWIWKAATTGQGYGNFWTGGSDRRYRAAHRWLYEQLVGPIDDGLELDHLCRVRNCVNPTHLEPVTTAENTRRGLAPIVHNWDATHCPAGHAYDVANTYVYGTNRKCRACRREYQRLIVRPALRAARAGT